MRDVVIIGAGPAGLSAALYTSRMGLDTLILDANVAGGQLLKTDKIDNYLGGHSTNAEELADKMIEDATRFGAELQEFANVTSIERKDGVWTVNYELLDLELTVEAKTVLVASGTTYNKLENLPDNLTNVSYCAVCDGPFYSDKDIAIVGAGDAAFESALLLSPIVRSVKIIVRSSPRAKQHLVDSISQLDNVELIYGTLDGYVLNGSDVKLITVGDKDYEIDGLFVHIGLKPNSTFVEQSDLTDGHLYQDYLIADKLDNKLAEGLFVAGDVNNPAHKQVAIAVGDGARAALEINDYIRLGE